MAVAAYERDVSFDCAAQHLPSSAVAAAPLVNFLPQTSIVDARGISKSPVFDGESPKKRCVNMFSSQKFREWLKYEWLYSVTDREIFLSPNDFQIILREHFPTLKTRYLRRGHWGIIRRMIGKPRRFSHTFLSEERESVQGKRRNLQYLQHIALTGLLEPMASEHFDSLLTCLPATTRIPLRLRTGTKVCVWLSTPNQGLFLGFIQDSFFSDGHYNVWIEDSLFSTGIVDSTTTSTKPDSSFRGFHVVRDEDVLTLPNQAPPDSIPLSILRYHFKENSALNISSLAPNYRVSAPSDNIRSSGSTTVRSDYENSGHVCASDGPLLSENICATECPLDTITHTDLSHELMVSNVRQNLGNEQNFPISDPAAHLMNRQMYAQLCRSLVRLYRLLEQKCCSVETLREMNNVVQAKLSENRDDITVQFQHSYATLILHLDKLNQELKYHMDVVLTHVATIAQESNMIHLDHITDWRRRCDDEAQEMVSRINIVQHQGRSNFDEGKLDLVARLSSILIHLCNLSDQRFLNQSLVCIGDLMKEIRHYLHPSNVKCFEMTVEHFVGQIIHAVTSALNTRMQPAYPKVAPSQHIQPTGAYTENLTVM